MGFKARRDPRPVIKCPEQCPQFLLVQKVPDPAVPRPRKQWWTHDICLESDAIARLDSLQPGQYLLADKAYDADWIRDLIWEQGAIDVIPPG